MLWCNREHRPTRGQPPAFVGRINAARILQPLSLPPHNPIHFRPHPLTVNAEETQDDDDRYDDIDDGDIFLVEDDDGQIYAYFLDPMYEEGEEEEEEEEWEEVKVAASPAPRKRILTTTSSVSPRASEITHTTTTTTTAPAIPPLQEISGKSTDGNTHIKKDPKAINQKTMGSAINILFVIAVILIPFIALFGGLGSSR